MEATNGSGVGPSADGFVEFRAAGDAVEGEYRCSECGYGVVVLGVLPECPMCRSSTWERGAWSGLGRLRAPL